MKDTVELNLSVIKTFPRSFNQLNDEQRVFLCMVDITRLGEYEPHFKEKLNHWCCIEGGKTREEYQQLRRRVIEKYSSHKD